MEFWEQPPDSTMGFVRQAEIKHGRVAMAGFFGYIMQENGFRWSWALTGDAPDNSSFQGLSVPEVWDGIRFEAQFQIIVTIGFFEF